MSILHPKDWVRMAELKKLQKEAASLTASNIPIPSWLSEKIAELRADLAGS